MGLLNDARLGVRAIRSLVQQRRARGSLQRKLALRPPSPQGEYRIAVYFADSAVNMYQIRQWYRPLVEPRPHAPGGDPQPPPQRGRRAPRREPAAGRVRAPGGRPRARDRGAGHPCRPLRQPEHPQLPDDAVRAPLARLRQPRRVRQDVHDHEPVQGVRLQPDRGGRGPRPARQGALGLRPRPARDPHRPSAGGPLRGRAAVHAGRPDRRALRPHLGGRPGGGRVRVHRLARRPARARPDRHGSAPRRVPPAPALGRRRPRVHAGEPRDRGHAGAGQRAGPSAQHVVDRSRGNSAGSCPRPTWPSSTSRPWSTTGWRRGSRSW
ncbi:hypothetical protein WDV94_07800 [Clavibacter tessellarius]